MWTCDFCEFVNERPTPCEICGAKYPLTDEGRKDAAAKVIKDRIAAYYMCEAEKKQQEARNDAKELEESRRESKHTCKSSDNDGYCSICKKIMTFTWVADNVQNDMTHDEKITKINSALSN
jgi:hypothetical protein